MAIKCVEEVCTELKFESLADWETLHGTNTLIKVGARPCVGLDIGIPKGKRRWIDKGSFVEVQIRGRVKWIIVSAANSVVGTPGTRTGQIPPPLAAKPPGRDTLVDVRTGKPEK
jgi:hypothetical protein